MDILLSEIMGKHCQNCGRRMQTDCSKIEYPAMKKILPKEKAGRYISIIVFNNAESIDTQSNAMKRNLKKWDWWRVYYAEQFACWKRNKHTI